MTDTTTDFITITRAEVEVLDAQLGPGGCMACEKTADGPHEYDCQMVAGADEIRIHRDYISTFAFHREGAFTVCLLCGGMACDPDDIIDAHDGDCSLAGVRL